VESFSITNLHPFPQATSSVQTTFPYDCLFLRAAFFLFFESLCITKGELDFKVWGNGESSNQEKGEACHQFPGGRSVQISLSIKMTMRVGERLYTLLDAWATECLSRCEA